jgi:hypothetical protein
VAGCCEYSDEPLGSCAMELVSFMLSLTHDLMAQHCSLLNVTGSIAITQLLGSWYEVREQYCHDLSRK